VKRHLILFTANHPFTHRGGETMFVAPELTHLAQAFGSVTVVPLYDNGPALPLPAGVVVDRRLAQGWARGVAVHAAAALAWPGVVAELGRAARHGGVPGFARVWRWAAIAKATRVWLAQHGRRGDDVLLYSYWRGGQSLAAARAADEGAVGAAVTRVHGHDLYEDAFAPPFQPWPGVYGQLARTITVSQHACNHLLDRGVAPQRLLVSRLGVVAAPALAQASSDGQWRIMSCAAITASKRVDLTARVLGALARRHPQQAIVWTHFGDGASRARVDDEVQRLPANVRAELRGQVSNTDVLAHYGSRPVDLFVHLSAQEGLPVSIQEALAHGVPVIACDVHGVVEAFDAESRVAALLPVDVPLEDAVAALEGVLLAAPQERAAQRTRAWRHWQRDFDAQRNHARLAHALAAL
jgi:colanic acid/amylovoran biosynthesis glycosyltransferase